MKRLAATVFALFLGTSAFAAEPGATKRVDINSATEEQLKALPGVGEEGAKRIIAARPYQKKDDLKTKNVVPADTFEKIQRLIESVC